MGIKGLQTVIDDNLHLICGPAETVQGELVIDGVNLLHELYLQHHLDWANGGCYAELRQITIEFFANLKSAGVRPTVVIDGAGIESHLKDKVYRRNLSIGDIPGCIQRAHTPGHVGETRHFLPELSRMTFVSAVKEAGDIPLYFTDGKANTTAVMLANNYHCPVLGNDTNYCVFDIHSGVILYKHLNINVSTHTCTAHVVQRGHLFQGFFNLNDHSLAFAMIAMLGDGGPELPDLYCARSELQHMIDSQPGIDYAHHREQDRPINVAKFLESFGSLQEFESRVSRFRLSDKCKSQLTGSCAKAERRYTISLSMSREFLQNNTIIQCSLPCELPPPLLRQFRNGDLPDFLIDAIALGRTYLCQQVGDVNQPPVVVLGCPVREAAYGFARKLMNKRSSKSIIEYHRNAFGATRGLNYSEHQTEPDHSTRKRLGVTKIAELNEEHRKRLARQAICTVFGCTWEDIGVFDNDREESWMLIVAMTRFWVRHQLVQQLPLADHVIRSLVYSFVRCSSRVRGEGHQQPHHLPDTFGHPNWIRVYHAALEWQCLYADTVGLNAILMQPFEVPSPACLYDGQIVLHYAVRDGVEAQVGQLSQQERQLYDKLLTAIIRD